MLKETFINLFKNYTDNDLIIAESWAEIEQNYTHKKRHYHTLSHLDNLLAQLTAVKDKIEGRDTVLFTLFYHDVVYDVMKSDNEEQSAKLAEKRMKQISAPDYIIKNCKNQILATKKHLAHPQSDTNYFTDADLSILGQSLENYIAYSQNVRKEYSVYPDLVYIPGRKKVLEHFIKMERIYKTAYFYHKFEHQAKQNLQFELEHI